MELTDRQEQILNLLVKKYIEKAEPISSEFLKEKSGLLVSPATIRNDLQELTEMGYVVQPHTSAGRVPTEKGYRYFISITFSENNDEFPNFISREIENTKQKIERELQLVRQLADSLTHISSTLSYTKLQDKDTVFEMLKIIGPSRESYDENVDLMQELIKKLQNF